ncbi:MAG: DUF3320 domain-containing protein [Candidatus Sericytochromatia bacterium]|nr:DUF3320 domain-containing protein [Candidatus Sericytochromatia bacterium]
MSTLAATLERARKELLDLGLRNPMLNFRPSRARGLTLEGLPPDVAWQRLIREDKPFSFVEGGPDVDGQAASEGRLLVPMEAEALQQVLLNTQRAARTFLEEQGAQVLYLALGMLAWTEPDRPETRHAPLLLVPVTLLRPHALARFQLRWNQGDLVENLSLAARLAADHGITLPPVAPVEDLVPSRYMAEVAERVAGVGYRVEPEAVSLGLFASSKLLMYRDLDPAALGGHGGQALVAAVLEEGFPAPEALAPVRPQGVVDMDASQAAAVAAVAAGQSLVIQGPPGTGKSQTITNIVAEALRQGKTVLFVAEKLAALEVVRRRLTAVGLGDALLELHSHKASKRELLGELGRTLALPQPRVEASADDEEALHGELRDKLDAYAEAVNTPVGESGVTPHEAITALLRLGREGGEARLPEEAIPLTLAAWTRAEHLRRQALTVELRTLLSAIGALRHHPFAGARVEHVRPGEEAAIAGEVARTRAALQAWLPALKALSEGLGRPCPGSWRGARQLLRALVHLRDAHRLQGVDLGHAGWSAHRDKLEALLEAGAAWAWLRATWGDRVQPGAWDLDHSATRDAVATWGRRWSRSFVGAWRRSQRLLVRHCRGGVPADPADQLAVLDALAQGRRLRQELRQESGLAGLLFGPQWRGEDSTWPELRATAERVWAIQADLAAGELPADFAAWPLPDWLPAAPPPAVGAAETAAVAFDDAWGRLAARLVYSPAGAAPQDEPFEALEARMAGWQAEPERLQDLAAYNRLRLSLRDEQLERLVAVVEQPGGEALVPGLDQRLERAWFEALLERAIRERPALAQFEGNSQMLLRDRFGHLERKVQVHHRSRLAQQHHARLTARSEDRSWVTLRQELAKRTRHLPIRQLVARAGGAIQALKPVFMMSPLSVATYLPAGAVTFDLVVFDEASQVRPVDALGALLRGRQLVVVGDKRQMPPTNFFDSLASNADVPEDEEGLVTEDYESLLGLCEAQGVPQRMLRWHYRSRHESLIALSNQAFYEGRLIVFPSPDAHREEAGLRLRHLPDAIYDRGRTRTSPREAVAVAEAVMQHARAHPTRSLGVAAFSLSQAEAILAELERLRRACPECEPFFAGDDAAGREEPFFVKNLETVQGDERDVIYISVGYGRDAEGRVSANFGPLNQEGGERRLNVLITRARLRCEVFTGLQAEDIPEGPGESLGVSTLRRFLAYARDGRLGAVRVDDAREAAAPTLADELHEVLQAAGIAAVRGVGSHGGRLELVVGASGAEGHHRLAVLCDGPEYHRAGPAGDRDRLREQVLVGLGWQLHHAWSVEWLRRPGLERQRLLAAVEQALTVAAAPEAPPPMPGLPEVDLAAGVAPEAGVAPYRVVGLPGLSGADLASLGVPAIAEAVAEVVRGEGPVHATEVLRRVTQAAGLKRVTVKARQLVDDAVAWLGPEGVERRGEFLWPTGLAEAPLRDRSGLPATGRKVGLIAPEELAGALQLVVRRAGGARPREAALEALKLLGLAKPGEDALATVEALAAALAEAGALGRRGEFLVEARATVPE